MHSAAFVPETMPVLKLLESMRGNPVRMVIVSDEYGAVLGIVTAADLLESIAGDAALGEDEGLTPPVQRDDGSWLVDGMTPVDEFEQLVGVRGLDDDEGYSTVAGLVMHLLRAVPNDGDKTETHAAYLRSRRHGRPPHRQGAGAQARAGRRRSDG